MFRATALTVSMLAAGLGLTTLGSAGASEHRGTTPHFRGPVVVGGVCSGSAAYYGTVHQEGDRIVFRLHLRRAGDRVRWNFTTEATTYFGDGTAVTGIGDFGRTRTDASGHATVSAATPLGVRHEFKLTLGRPKADEHCFVRVKA
jgi:hypothetical protein